jgi:gamma-polyglutamate synthase
MLFFGLLVIVLVFLVWEQQLHRRRLRQIPLRIHVNGTRGKTTVTRLTAELLRRAGIRSQINSTHNWHKDSSHRPLPSGPH